MKFNNLQALRGIAAITVVVFHLGAMSQHDDGLLLYSFDRGIFGVDLFFVLSGFLIFYTTRNKLNDWRGFIFRRAARIYPLYWICLLIGTPTAIIITRALLGSPTPDLMFYIQSIALLPVINQYDQFYPAIGVAWTLIYEMFFYALVAGLMLATGRLRVWHLAVGLICAYAISFVLPLGAWQRFLSNPIYFEFLIGALLFMAWRAEKIRLGLVFAALVPGLVLLAMGYPSEPLRFVYFGPAAFGLMALALWLETRSISAPPVFSFMGDASYAIYISHQLFLKFSVSNLREFDLSPAVLSLLSLLIAIGLGCVLYVVVDRPVQWFVVRVSKQR